MNETTITYGLLGGLAIAVLWAAITDLRVRRITNRLTLTVAATAPLFWWAAGLSPWPDIAIQIGLAVAMFAFGAVMFKLRQMGGGDVKLLTAIALWLPPAVFGTLMLMICLVNGVLTIVMVTRYRRIQRAGLEAKQLQIPYGLSVAVCMLALLAVRYGPGAQQAFSTNALLS